MFGSPGKFIGFDRNFDFNMRRKERRETVKKEVVIFIPRIQLGITFDRMGDVRNGQKASEQATA